MSPVLPLQPVAPDSKPPLVTRSPPLTVLTVSVALPEVAVVAGDDESVTLALNTAPLSVLCAVNE